MNSQKKIIVGMSGGVDSSVTALLCLEKGYEVAGLYMKNWDEDDGTDYCTSMEDLADAKAKGKKFAQLTSSIRAGMAFIMLFTIPSKKHSVPSVTSLEPAY